MLPKTQLSFALILSIHFIANAQWQNRNTGLEGGRIRSIVAHNGNFYAATADRGIFVSTDNAASWSAANNGINSFAIYALESFNGILFSGGSGGVYRSTDNGTTWTTNFGVPSFVTDFLTHGSHIFAATDAKGLFRSSDNGITWVKVDSGLAPVYITCLSSDGSRLYAGTNNGLYSSDDNGDHWVRINVGGGAFYYGVANIGKDLYVTKGDGVMKSVDLGATWSNVNFGLSDTFVVALVAYGKELYAGTFSGGIFYTANGGSRWSPLNAGITDKSIYALAFTPGVFLAGSDGGGVFKSTNKGAGWVPATKGLHAVPISFLKSEGSTVYAGTTNGLYRSLNQGLFWEPLTRDLVYASRRVSGLVLKGVEMFMATEGGVYKSLDNGNSWILSYKSSSNSAVLNIVVTKSGRIYAGTVSGLVVSEDGGNSWKSANIPSINAPYVSALDYNGTDLYVATWSDGIFRMNESDGQWMYAGLKDPDLHFNEFDFQENSVLVSTRGRGILRSIDKGMTWLQTNAGLIDGWAYGLASTAEHIFTATLNGAYGSVDGGQTWIDLNVGASFLSAITVDEKNIYTSGKGDVWVLDRKDLIVSIEKEGLRSAIIFPNPAQGVVYIRLAEVNECYSASYRFTNAGGTTLLAGMCSSVSDKELVVDITTLTPGLYTLNLDLCGKRRMFPIVIK